MSKQHLAIKKKNIAITEKGVVIEGDAAGQLATLLIRHREQLLTAARQVDDEIKLNDIYVDEAGRVVLRSRKMQQYAYEAIRLGASPASAKGLGRLVKRTGGKIGTARLKSKILADPDSVRQTLRPTLQGGGSIHEANFICGGGNTPNDPSDDGFNLVCGQWDEILEDETDFNCFCGWDRY